MTKFSRCVTTAYIAVLIPCVTGSQEAPVPDSIIRGSLVYKAEGGVGYSGRGKLGSPGIMGDVDVTVTIKNIGSAPVHTVVKGCGTVRLRAYATPSRTGVAADSQSWNESYCNVQPVTAFSLDPGHSRVFNNSLQGWVVAGGRKSLGPWYIVAELHLPDMVLDLRAGEATFDPGLRTLTYKVRTNVEGTAPTSLVTHITAYNNGADTVHLEYGACAIDLQAYRNPKKTGKPVWVSSRRGPPAQVVRNFNMYPRYICPDYLAIGSIAPHDSASPREFTESVRTYEILADSLPAGRYYFTAAFSLNWRIVDLDAGYADLSKGLDPIHASRTIHGIKYSANVRRIHNSSGDSLEVKLTVQNLGNVRRERKPSNSSDPISLSGYSSHSDRDTHYLGARSQWSMRALELPDFVLEPHESRTFTNVIAAPSARLYYLGAFRIKDDGARDASTPFVDLGIDER
ncbi:MAG: hypothetical protein ABR582_01140 [Gemmatimonadaceae bacterium]